MYIYIYILQRNCFLPLQSKKLYAFDHSASHETTEWSNVYHSASHETTTHCSGQTRTTLPSMKLTTLPLMKLHVYEACI